MSQQLQSLSDLGWDPGFIPEPQPGSIPGRIVAQHRQSYEVACESGIYATELTGSFRRALASDEMPVVGDWVTIHPHPGTSTVASVAPRRTSLMRKVAGRTTLPQAIAANLDIVFVVAALDGGVNQRRLERYLATAWEGGTEPVVVLTKPDLATDLDEEVAAARGAAVGVDVIVVNGITGDGIEVLQSYLLPHRTGALVGPSGVGKSSITNVLLGTSEQYVQDVREDGRGRHTTSSRRLLVLPGGGCLIDTPGMRELAPYVGTDGVTDAFPEIAERAAECRFRDCTHSREPGCAVRAAVDDGKIPADRLKAFGKLSREQAYLARKVDQRAAREEANRWKQITKAMRDDERLNRDR